MRILRETWKIRVPPLEECGRRREDSFKPSRVICFR
jgi:hypothetical protein